MKAIAYCRVSTLEQGEKVSLENQRARIAAWCVVNGYELADVFVETMSGSKASNRPELQKALASVCKHRGVLVVYSLSRLARSVKDTIEISEKLEKHGANLASLTEKIDTSNSIGRFFYLLVSNLAELERSQLAERVTSAMSHLRNTNKRISAKIPFGYDLAADGENLTQNQAEQDVISQMKHWKENGESYVTISKKLNETNVATKQGKNWYPCTVRFILIRNQKLAS